MLERQERLVAKSIHKYLHTLSFSMAPLHLPWPSFRSSCLHCRGWCALTFIWISLADALLQLFQSMSVDSVQHVSFWGGCR